MGVIWTSRTRTKQPQGVVGLAPRYAGLAQGAWLLTQSVRDVSGRAKHGAATAVTLTALGADFAATNSIIALPTGSLDTTSDVTVVIHSLARTSGPGGSGRLIDTGTSAGVGYLVSRYVSGNDLLAGGSTDFGFPSSSVLKYGVFQTIVLVVRGSTREVWAEGTLVYSASGFGSLTSSSAVAPAIGNRSNGGTDRAFDGIIKAVAVLAIGVPSVEAQSLSANPWQLFAPERRPIFFNTAGGGSTVTGVGSSDGIGTVSGVGASTSAQVGSSAGVGAASGVGRSTANSVGSSSGTGTASGAGSSTGGSDGAGSATGTGTATGVGASTAASLGSTAGVGTASGIGASTAASVGSASGTGTASGVGTNGSIVSTGVGSASGTGTATGISPTVSRGGGKTTGSNLSRKQKKKLKAVESQEWLKAEETARQLLSDRFTKQTPQEKAQALETYIESLQPVIEALKALTSQIEEVVEEAPVIELTPHQEVIQRFDRLEKKVKSVEELIIILMADL